DLFYRKMRRADVRDILAAEQVFHLANLEFALGETGIAAVGATLIANARQPVRVDGQSEQLVLVRTQRCGKLQALHIIVRQWVVGRADTVLQCHIEAGRRFAAPGYTHQNDVRFLVDRKSTRLNSSHVKISYAVFCLKKKKEIRDI